MKKYISGFSKLTKKEKIKWITKLYFEDSLKAESELKKYWNSDTEIQQIHDEFIENTLSNFYMPFGVAPNFIIDGKDYTLPMVIEESSVVAAASKTAKYWSRRGGFHTKILNIEKSGQIHFLFDGNKNEIDEFFKKNKKQLLESCFDISLKMTKRGGGIQSIELIDKTSDLKNYFQISVHFITIDAMGANFINSCLEKISKTLNNLFIKANLNEKYKLEIIMSIMSNHVPNCLVKSWASCSIDDLDENDSINGRQFAEKFVNAINISKIDLNRAVTNNKGIMNGIDSLVLSTGNDFRAVEASIHAFAAKNGRYKGLTNAFIKDKMFTIELTIPLSIGTVGGLTKLHPLVRWSMDLLGNPNAKELMSIICVSGLAQNFAAVRSLITSGIQKGHMKLHLLNILNQLKASKKQKKDALLFFIDKEVNYTNVEKFLNR
ncbi:MAG: hydroxymethylglutaryl-CoA reductase, degradative [Flavobacteriaceae bacterium]|nr:hydroxymethylglutaryl-CoA reductase, degradative [Flavobacteriaceae bacterium]|tara:strand:+ start:22563 stop:23864 length:1302 start_codon:yes stop_codon:yes gene_type:complete